MRLAWFTPWPPQATGVAGRSAEVVPLLATAGHGVDVFVDERHVPVGPASADPPPDPGQVRVQSAHDFVWRVGRHQYDLIVYQVGNSKAHEFTWPYLVKWPGLAVLHDACLHHARGRALLSAGRADAYRTEFTWNHPAVRPEVAELAVHGFDGVYYYLWPMLRTVVASSRLVAVHSRGAQRELAASFPEDDVAYVALGEGNVELPSEDARRAARASLGVDPESVVLGVFGGLTPEKRISAVLRAFHSTLARYPAARLILAGAPDPTARWADEAARIGIAHATTFPGVLDDESFARAIAAVDVVLSLRWPTAVETSGPWLRALAASRATVVMELPHQAHVPALDPRTWRSWQPFDRRQPVTVAVDLLDEHHSLGLAMRRLVEDGDLRDQLGRAGRRYWEREHQVSRMTDDYLAAIQRAASRPLPAASLPAGLVADPERHVRELLVPFGELPCELF